MESDAIKWKTLRNLYQGKNFLVGVLLAQIEGMAKQIEAKEQEIAWLRKELSPSTKKE